MDSDNNPKLYLCEPSGALTAWKATAIGKNSDKVLPLLEEGYEDNISFQKGIRLVLDSLLQFVESGVNNMEIAYLRRGEKLQSIPDGDLEKLINEIEEKKLKEDKSKKV